MKAIIVFSVLFFLVAIVVAQPLTTLVWFNEPNGKYPTSTLIQSVDGDFYGSTTGTTINGDYGTIFKITPEGVLTTLVYFNSTNANGGAPWAGLIQANDGNFYSFGGFGAIKMTPSGQLMNLVNANNNNINFRGSYGKLTQGTDGKLYGIGYGGLYNKGVIFSMTTNGTLTDLADFDGTNGEYEIGYNGLTLGKDGNFYGATGGGMADDGVIFQVTTNGVLTKLFDFSDTNGYAVGTNSLIPYGNLMQASDGNFYGTTWGDAIDDGTVFRMTRDGDITTMARFNGVNGEAPHAGLIQASDGNFYGTTTTSVFKLTLNGVLTSIVTFNGTNGSGCYSALVEGNDGNLYGTTSGGAYGYGTVFKISGLNLLPSFQSIILTNGNVNLTWNSVSNWTYRVQYKTSLNDTNWTDLPVDILATNTTSSKTDAAVPTGRFYRLVLLR